MKKIGHYAGSLRSQPSPEASLRELLSDYLILKRKRFTGLGANRHYAKRVESALRPKLSAIGLDLDKASKTELLMATLPVRPADARLMLAELGAPARLTGRNPDDHDDDQICGEGHNWYDDLA